MSSVEQKVAGSFLAFLDENVTRQRIELPSKKAIIASRLGLQPKTFLRVLRKMKTRGVIIEENGGLIILKPQKLNTE